MKYIPSLDILKWCMAVLIVATHCQLFVEDSRTYMIYAHFSEVAVPTFFCISSYLLFSRILNKPMDKSLIFQTTIKRLIMFFLIWYILMLPFSISDFYNKATVKEILFAIPFSCAFRGYWFLKALIINMLIVYWAWNKNLLLIVAGLFAFCYLFFGYDYVYGSVSDTLHPYFSFYHHTYFFAIGAIVAKYRHFLPWFLNSKAFLYVCFVIVFLLSFVEWLRVLSVFCYPLILLLIVLNTKVNIPIPIAKQARMQSILYYAMHFGLIKIYSIICPDSNSFLRFGIVITVCILLSTLLLRLETVRGFGFVKYMH